MATASDLIAEVRKRLEKKYRDSTELFLDLTTAKQIDVIPSPSAIINAVTGIGGFPRGRVTEIHGPYSSGKTTLATEICVAAQRVPGAVVMFVDYEHAFDPSYAHTLGLDLSPERFVFSQPEYFEQGDAIIDEFLNEGLVDIIVIDSAAAMTPKAELEAEPDVDGGTQKGLQAALMSRFLARVTKKLSKGRRPALILLNQMRANIQIGGRPQKNAPKEQPAGGAALKFYTSIRLELEIVRNEGEEGRDTKGTDQVYQQSRIRVTAVKNKLAPPFVRGQFVIKYGKGIDNVTSIAELAEAKLGIMSGAGFFSYEGSRPETSFSCRGREAFQELLNKNPDIRKEIEEKVLSAIKQDHAKALGIGAIKVTEQAKEVEAEAGTLYLGGSNPKGLPVEDSE